MESKESNALRAAARAVIKEVDAAWCAAGVKTGATSARQRKRDEISRQILDRWEAKLYPRFSKVQLIYAIGVVKGILKEF